MKTWQKLALVFVPLGALCAWIVVDNEQRNALLTAEGTATVTGVVLHEDADSPSLDETEFRLLLSAGDRRVSTTATLPGNRTEEFRQGHTFVVCYNPDDPAEVDITLDREPSCGE